MAGLTGQLPVLWICGAPGVGKSTIAWKVVELMREQGARLVYVDIDQLGICYPERADDPGRHRIKARNLALVAENFRTRGAAGVVVSGVIEDESATWIGDRGVIGRQRILGAVHSYAGAASPDSITWCLLHLDPGQLRERLAERGWSKRLQDASIRYAEVVAQSSFTDLSVDTTGRTIDEVAALVLQQIPGWPPISSSLGDQLVASAQPASDGDPGTAALWISGPTAVGKSAVGWVIYQRALGAGTRAAYVDLQQVGQLAPSGSDDGHDSHLEARNLACIWQTAREAGARVLVFSGRVDGPETVRLFAGQLAPTELTTCRLQASEPALTERVRLRASGSGWREPTDRLRDLSPDQVGEVVAAALEEEHQLDQVGDFTVDTVGLTVEQVADEVLDGAPRWRRLSGLGTDS